MATIIPGSSGTILFANEDKAVQHVLEDLLRMSPDTIDKVKAWMNFHKADTIPKLMDLYMDDDKSIMQPEYRTGDTKQRLEKWANVGLHLICRFGARIISTEHYLPDDQAWLQFTLEDFNAFKVQAIIKSNTPITPQTPTTPSVYTPTPTPISATRRS